MPSPSPFLSTHSRRLGALGSLFTPASPQTTRYHAHEIHPAQGYGSNDLYDFERIRMGRGKFCFNQDTRLRCEMPFHSLGVTLFLTGRFDLVFRDTGEQRTVDPPLVALRRGRIGEFDFHFPASMPVSMLSLDFGEELLGRISRSDANNDISGFFAQADTADVLVLDQLSPQLIYAAQYVIGLPKASSELDLINMEGQALSLLGCLFRQASEQGDRYRKEIDAATAWLQAHCQEKISVRMLAREVGMNECYLKRYFKQYTGLTIGAWLEKYRMDSALMLFSQGKPLHKVYYAVGYNDPNYFKQVFKKHFGYLPPHW